MANQQSGTARVHQVPAEAARPSSSGPALSPDQVRSWRLNGSLVFVDPMCDDDTWRKALEYSILERFAQDNAGWIARKVDSRTLYRFPMSAHFEIYHGVVPRIERLPRYAYYKKWLTVMSENHFALTRYGYDELKAAPTDDMKAYLRGRVNVYNDVHNLAVRTTDAAFDRCRGLWASRCSDAVERFGDVFVKVFGESEPYYGEVSDPWGEGDLLAGGR